MILLSYFQLPPMIDVLMYSSPSNVADLLERAEILRLRKSLDSVQPGDFFEFQSDLLESVICNRLMGYGNFVEVISCDKEGNYRVRKLADDEANTKRCELEAEFWLTRKAPSFLRPMLLRLLLG
jgi:hypothetical protein